VSISSIVSSAAVAAPGGTEIHKKSKVPHSPTYHSLISLEEKGFVNITPIKPKKFSAIEPKIAINNFINRQIKHTKEIQQDIADELSKIRSINPPEEKMIEKITIASGSDKVFPLIENLCDSSHKEMLGMLKKLHKVLNG